MRNRLFNDNSFIELKDFGAGSRVSSINKRSVKSIAKYACTPKKFSAFLNALINYFKVENILELGTSLGINTLYLSQNEGTKVITLEGDPSIAKMAFEHFKLQNRANIEVVVGNIDETLQGALSKVYKLDLVYLDANHRYEPTLRYFDQILPKCTEDTIIIVDDIHWSREMAQAWTQLKLHPSTTLSVDLFEAGILWLNPNLETEAYTLRF
ncbi:O-methyltransferase [Roseivirga sp.]|uniref:O-methyltransferase n=1 Tax=Roseivirga sp. TaxID=1964215 RepID=UPI003B8C5E0E